MEILWGQGMGLAGSSLPGVFSTGITVLRQREMQRCPFGTGRGEAAAPGRDSRRGLSPAGSGVVRIPPPRPFPLGIPGLTHRARDCEACQEILLGIRGVCLPGVRIFLPLARPDGHRAQGTGHGTQHGLSDKPTCPGSILQVSTSSSDSPSREGSAQP